METMGFVFGIMGFCFGLIGFCIAVNADAAIKKLKAELADLRNDVQALKGGGKE